MMYFFMHVDFEIVIRLNCKSQGCQPPNETRNVGAQEPTSLAESCILIRIVIK